MPKKNPTAVEKIVASRIALRLTFGVNGVPEAAAMRPTAKEINQPKMMPMTPPIKLRREDSVRNWIRISALRAPTALRRPIS